MKNDPNSAAETLILPEAAKFLRISRSHLLNILKGKVAGVPLLPYSRVGRRLLFRRAALEQWLREVEAGTSGGELPLIGNEQGANMLGGPVRTPETPERKPCVESDFSMAACER